MMKRDLSVARAAWIAEAESDEERELRQRSDFLQYKNQAGLFADFHANRHTFITNLEKGGVSGVSPKTAQTLARHSDIRLTMNVYTHTNLSDMVEAVGKLPSLRSDSVLPPVEKPQVKTSRKEARKAKWKERLQRYSSISVVEHGNSRQLPSEGVDARTTRSEEGGDRKSLPDRDLAEDDGACHSKSKVQRRQRFS